MKSAYELAMERLNKSAPSVKLTAEQKARLAELDSIYKAKLADREVSSGTETITYPHIPVQTLFPPAEASLVRTDIKNLATKIGYVMGAGDEVPASLRQIGCEVTLLSSEDLARGDLSKFDTVITGGQKGLSSIPGVSLIAFSDAAWERVRTRTAPNTHWCLDAVLAAFAADHPRSRELHGRASRSMLGGVPMNWMVKWAGPYPLFVESAAGAHFRCVDGHDYVDLCLGDTFTNIG